MDRAPVLRIVKKWFYRFPQSDVNLNHHPRSGRTSNVGENVLFAFVENKLNISTEGIAKSSKIDISNAFCHFKKIGCQISGWNRSLIVFLQQFHCCYATKRIHSWMEFSQTMEDESFMIMFDANGAENKLVILQIPWLKRACIR